MKITILDLRKCFPRSPREKLGGFVHLARVIDKARAKGAGLLGEYLYPCPLDKRLLEFVGIDAADFLEAAAEREDHEILIWLQSVGRSWTRDEIQAWSKSFLNQGPDDEEGRKRFTKTRKRVAPERTDITAWVDLLDLDEGRDVSVKNNPTDA